MSTETTKLDDFEYRTLTKFSTGAVRNGWQLRQAEEQAAYVRLVNREMLWEAYDLDGNTVLTEIGAKALAARTPALNRLWSWLTRKT